jgi:hypothetical protein
LPDIDHFREAADVAGNHSEELAKGEGATAFVPMPIRHGDVLRVLGPKPGEAAVAVEPLVKLDQPLTVVQSFVAGLCRADGGLVQPVEVTMVVDPTTVVPDKQVPTGALLETFDALPELHIKVPGHAGFELLRDILGKPERFAPVLYCRKRNCVFVARSPNGAKPLSALPEDQASGPGQELPAELPARLVSWDGPSEGGQVPRARALLSIG